MPIARDKAGRAIGGFSMGGLGAIRLSARYPKQFLAASSVLGPLDIMQWFPDYHRLKLLLGIEESSWRAQNPCSLAAGLSNVALWFRTGTDAGDCLQNEAFARRLNEIGIPHDFAILPGGHDVEFVRRCVSDQIVFHLRRFSMANQDAHHAISQDPCHHSRL